MWLHRSQRRNRPHQRGTGQLFCRTVIIFTLLFAVPVFSFGRGDQQDDTLSKADELIAQKRYTDAMNLLVPFMNGNPRQFDAAQKKIQQILKYKEEYNRVAQELLDEMDKLEPDNQRILALSERLYSLDPERIAETQDFITRTRNLALFRSSMRRLDIVLNEGQEFVDRGDYARALQTYAAGLDIYQADFFTGPYSAQMQNRARQQISSINSNIAPLTAAANGLQEAVNSLESLSAQGIEPQNITAYRTAYNRLAGEMERFTNLRNNFANSDSIFREDLAQLRRDFPQLGDRNFLAFAIRLLEGRANTSGGMLGVFDTVWGKAIPRARELLDQKLQTAYSAIVLDASTQEYGRIGAHADALDAYASFPADLEVKWGNYDLAQKENIFDQRIPAAEAGYYLKFRYLRESSAQWRTLGQLGTRYRGIPNQDSISLWRNGGNGDELIQIEANKVSSLRQIRADARSLLAVIGQDSSRYQPLENRFPNPGAANYRDGVNKATEELISHLRFFDEASSFQRYTIANGLIAARQASRDAELREATALFLGTPLSLDYTARYPTSAFRILTQMDTSYESDRQALQTVLSQHNSEPAELAAEARIRLLQREAAAMLTNLDSSRTQGRSLATVARNQSIDAANHRTDGNRLYTEAQNLLARGDFENALNRVQRAAIVYDQSLNLEFDETIWNMRTLSIDSLDKTIVEQYNQVIIRQVEEIIDQIQNSYYASEFERAEMLISRADTIWKKTQKSDNPDLAYWTQMILAGMRSGRTIPPTAPLYAEMSQLLSDARKNYEEGRALILVSSSNNEGRRRLNSAKQNIEKIKLVYPMNEDAGILDLRIDALINPNFPALLNSKIQSAIQITKTNSITARIQAVNDLRTYRVAFPEFTNWEPIIFQAEVDASLRPRPPSQAEIEEARQIVNRYRSTIAGNNPEAIANALGELSRARRLDPNNRDAEALYISGTTKVRIIQTVLDPEAERLFQQASIALTQENPIRARQILNQIYGMNPDYRSVSKVITLQQRVNSRL